MGEICYQGQKKTGGSRLQGVTYPGTCGPMVMSPDYSTADSLFSLQHSVFLSQTYSCCVKAFS